MDSRRPQRRPLLGALLLALIAVACDANYSVTSRTRTDRNGDGRRDPGIVVIVTSNATTPDLSEPKRTTFEAAFGDRKADGSLALVVNDPQVVGSPQDVGSRADDRPRLQVRITNPGLEPIRQIELRVLVEHADEPIVHSDRIRFEKPLAPGASIEVRSSVDLGVIEWRGLYARAFAWQPE